MSDTLFGIAGLVIGLIFVAMIFAIAEFRSRRAAARKEAKAIAILATISEQQGLNAAAAYLRGQR